MPPAPTPRRRSSGSVWIEPRHGVPCRVCWRLAGKKQKPSPWYERRADALRVRDALRERVAATRPILVSGAALPLTEVRDRWLIARQAEGKMHAGTAIGARMDIDRILRDTEWKTVIDITPPSLRTWRVANPSAAKGTPIRCLRAMLRWASRHDTLAQPVPAGLDLSSPQTQLADRPRPPDEDLAMILARAARAGQGLLVHCLMTYPWRPSSFCKVLVRDLDLRDRLAATMLLRRTKNGKDVRGLLLPETRDRLLEHVAGLAPDAYVFTRADGSPWPLDKIGRAGALSKWFRKAIGFDMPARAYDLKRTGITDLLKASGGDIDAVAKIAGISKQMVVRYAQSNTASQRQLLERYAAARQGADRGQLGQRSVKTSNTPPPESPDFSVDYDSVKTSNTR